MEKFSSLNQTDETVPGAVAGGLADRVSGGGVRARFSRASFVLGSPLTLKVSNSARAGLQSRCQVLALDDVSISVVRRPVVRLILFPPSRYVCCVRSCFVGRRGVVAIGRPLRRLVPSAGRQDAHGRPPQVRLHLHSCVTLSRNIGRPGCYVCLALPSWTSVSCCVVCLLVVGSICIAARQQFCVQAVNTCIVGARSEDTLSL